MKAPLTASPGPQPAAWPDEPAPPAVSVVIPTRGRQALLRRCLDAVLAQQLDGLAFEVIVVDDGHDHETLRMIRAMQQTPTDAEGQPRPDLVYLRPRSGQGPAVARNCGWRAARSELIAFTDDDTVPQPGWLAHGLRAMANEPQWAALRGRVVVPLAPPPRRRPTDHELMTLGLQDAEFVTANAFVRRHALDQVGGFDERFTRPWREDSDLQFRLARDAGTVGQCADAVVLHPVRPERWGVCLRQQRNAYFDALLFKKHRQLYRARIRRVPPWRYYAIVALTGVALICAVLGQAGAALAGATGAAAFVLEFAWQRLRETSRAPRHVAEMLVTSALIPFLSVYWRMRGALRFRVLFL
jgi:glycosyltransferase involved in cell wall biosynthesis